MEERYIASVDLGTSKIAVCVARILGHDVQVVYYKESSSDGIRHSYVFNPKKVENELRKAISEAQQELKIRIQQVIVGLPRYYVRQETASASTERTDPDSQIQESEIRAIKSMALEDYPLTDSRNEVIYGAVAQSFSTEESFNELENDIVGMTAERLEGNFKVFIGNRRHSINIDNVFNSLNIAIAKKFFTPGITARAVLKEEQLENGVALIDLGAGVSSVTIFKGKIMRFYAAIPFGGNSVTNDIKSQCNISFPLAENLKMAFGACMPGKLSAHGEKIIQINDEEGVPAMQVSVKYLSEIITARMKEIIEALLYEIQISGYAAEDVLRAGVVVTGGGADMVNCASYIKELSGYSVKIGYPRPYFSCEGCEEARNVSAATTMGMIMAAKGDRLMNCISASPVRRIHPEPVKRQPQEKRDGLLPTASDEKEYPQAEPVVSPAEETTPVRAEVRAPEPVYEPEAEPETFSRPEPEPDALPTIESSVAAAQDEGPSVFDEHTDEEIEEYKKALQEEKLRKEREKAEEKKKKPKFTWLKHMQKTITNTITNNMGSMFDQMEEIRKGINDEEI